MKLEFIKCASGIFQRLKEPRVFQFKFQLNSQPTWQVTITRWATLLLYGWLAALVVYLLLPLIILIRPSHLLSLDGHPVWHWALLLTHVVISVMLVLYLQAKLYIRLPRRTFKCGYCFDIQSFLRYPSLHVAVILGVVLLFWLSCAGLDSSHDNNSNLFFAAIEKVTLLFWQDSADSSSDLDLSAFGLFLFLGVYGVFSVVRNEMTLRKMNEKKRNLDNKEYKDLLRCNDSEFKDWISSNKTGINIDFFDRTPYVNRIYQRLKSEISDNKRQFLSGEFGEGKTTIVELVERELDDNWIVSWFDCWERSGKAEELATQFMEQIIHDVGQQIDASSLARLPDSFAHALYGVSHWFSFLDPLLRPDTPAGVVLKLDRLLEANNRKLLVVVENVDRNKERDRFINMISAMLDKLSGNKEIKNIHIIFSADEDLIDTQIVYRISDYKERVQTIVRPEVILRFMTQCLKTLLDGKRNGESLIIPYLKQGFTLLDYVDVKEQIGAVEEALGLTPNSKDTFNGDSVERQVLNALADVLSNPRRLKYVLRHVNDLWTSKLAGEVNLFDLILYITVSYDDELKKTIQNYPQEILEGKGNSPYSSRLRDAMNKQSKNDQKSASQSKQFVVNMIDHDNLVGKINTESANTTGLSSSSITLDLHYSSGANSKNTKRFSGGSTREKIAFYLLNGHFYGGQRARNLLCQPIIDEHGIAEEEFRKYRKITDIGQVEGYADSDQEFLRNYIKASGAVLNADATKSVLNFGQNHQVIFKSLVKTMTCHYFKSVKELHQFTYNTIVLADLKYSETNSKSYDSIFSLCFTVMNFDGNGGKNHADAFEESLKAAFTELDRKKQYSFLMRMLWFLVVYGKENHFSSIVKNIVEEFITQSLAVRMGLNFRNNHPGTYELQYEFIYLFSEIYDAKHIFSEDVIKRAARTFLIIVGMRFKNYPSLIIEFHKINEDRLTSLKQIIEKELGTDINEGIELDVWKEIQRVVPAPTSKSEADPKAED